MLHRNQIGSPYNEKALDNNDFAIHCDVFDQLTCKESSSLSFLFIQLLSTQYVSIVGFTAIASDKFVLNEGTK